MTHNADKQRREQKPSRYILYLLLIYVLFALLYGLFQSRDTQRNQTRVIPLPNSGFDLHIEAPRKLTFDGNRRQGRITFSVYPQSVPSLSPVIESEIAAPSPTTIATDTLLATEAITDPAQPCIAESCPEQDKPLSSSPATDSASPAVSHNDSSPELGQGAQMQEWRFLISATEGARLVTSDGIAYTPIITLSASSGITEASFLIEHAALPDPPAYASITVEDHSNRALLSPVANISLERPWQLIWRKFLEITLSLASIFALVAIGFDYLNKKHEKELEQETEKREAKLKHTVSVLETADSEDIPSFVKRWTDLVSETDELPAEISSQFKEVFNASKKFARNNIAGLKNSNNGWIDEVYAIIERAESVLDKDDINWFSDLRYVTNALKHPPERPARDGEHCLTDAYLLGVYLNYAWTATAETEARQRLMAYLYGRADRASLEEDSPARHAILREALQGIHDYDTHITPAEESSLHKELGNWYSNLGISPLIPPPGDTMFNAAIAQIAGESGEKGDALWEWCRNLQVERQRREALGKEKRRIRNALWPVPVETSRTDTNDANYDYKPPPDQSDSTASENVGGASSDSANQWDVGVDKLNEPYHHYVQGLLGSGKSWLRIYFENTVGKGFASFVSVFYFPPIELIYEIEDRNFLYRSFARSVANCLVAALLESYTIEEQEIRELAPFLARYGYAVPLGGSSLASPTPPAADLDVFYANKAESYRLARMREAMQEARTRQTGTGSVDADQVLRDINVAISAVGFSRVYLLLDNLSPKHEKQLWRVLQSPEIADGLQSHKIYLKMFSVSPAPEAGWHIQYEEIINPNTDAKLSIHRLQP